MYQEKLKQVQNELTQTEKIIADFSKIIRSKRAVSRPISLRTG